MSATRLFARTAAAAAVLTLPTQAAQFCVDTAAELQTALTTTAASSADDVIRIVTGHYVRSRAASRPPCPQLEIS